MTDPNTNVSHAATADLSGVAAAAVLTQLPAATETYPADPTAELSRLASRESTLRWCLDEALILLHKTLRGDDVRELLVPHYRAFLERLDKMRPDLELSAGGPRRYPSEIPDILPALLESMNDLGDPQHEDYLCVLHENIRKLQGDNARLRGLLKGDPEVVGDIIRGVEVRHWAAKLVATSFIDSLEQAGAGNYLILNFQPKDRSAIEVTVQVADGKRPIDTIGELKAEIATLEAEMAELRANTP
jgi:hypothetical protein